MSRRPTRKLPWPASRLDRETLHELWIHAQASKQSITQIVKVAVETHLTHLLEQKFSRAAEPLLAYQADDSVAVPLPAA